MKVFKDIEGLIRDCWIRSVKEVFNYAVDINVYTDSPDVFSYFSSDDVGIIIGFEI